MKDYKPYRYQLRQSLFFSTILPVFLVIIIGLISFYAIYIWVEHRSISKHVVQSQQEITEINHTISKELSDKRRVIEDIDINKPADITRLKRILLTIVHQQDATLYYEIEGTKQTISNNYERFNTRDMYTLYRHAFTFKDNRYTIRFYIFNTSTLNKIKSESEQQAIMIDRFDNIVYTNGERFQVDDKFVPSKFGFISDNRTLNKQGEQLILYKDIHETLDDGLYLLIIMTVVLIILIIVGFMSAHQMAQRQTRDIETIIQKIYYAKNRHLGPYEPLSKHSELELINTYIYDLFESNEQLIKSIEQSEKRIRDIQLKEIEKQFQPHFLFNTMQTIQYLITMSPTQAQSVVQQLSQMLRYTLRTKTSQVTIQDELNYIKQYVSIQNTRFDNGIHLEIDIPNTLLQYAIDKMMIQPLVENAIKHGRDNQLISIYIKIKITSHFLRVFVRDDGLGMTPGCLKMVRESLVKDVFDTEHLGLNHLHHKARIRYGRCSRLRIFSKQQEGTLIIYQVPHKRRN